MASRGEIVGEGLIEDLAGWVEEDDMRVVPTDRVEPCGDRLRPHDHPCAAAIRRVVHAPVPAEAPLPQIVGSDDGDAAFLDPARNARGEGRRDHLGKQGQDVDLERHPDGFTRLTAARRAGRWAPSGVSGRSGGSGGVVPSTGSVAGDSADADAEASPTRARRREPWRRLGARGRSPSPPVAPRRPALGVRSSASVSTTISPRRGAKIRTKSRTPGTSNSPYGPPATV